VSGRRGFASSAPDAWLTERLTEATAISAPAKEAYVWPMISERLQHDIEVAERATAAFAFGVIIAAFVAVAAGAAVYDVGRWFAIW
jgi:hypothetical protein